jgi:RNA polymerase sigma-70 factor (sigma-E family)
MALWGHVRGQGHTMNVDQDFAEFVAARWAALYRLAYLLTASPPAAEDLLQTTLEKAYVRWARIVGMEHAEAYVRRMIANTYLSGRRRAWVREEPRDRMPEAVGSVEGTLLDRALLDRALLWPLVCALPARQRAVIVLRYYEDLSEAEIAHTLGCAPGTVKSQSSAAMKALRRALAAAGVAEAVGES